MSRPFLILQLRPIDAVADQEFYAFLAYGNLSESDVVRIQMDRDVLPILNLDDYSGVIVGGGPSNASDPLEKKSESQRRFESWLFPYLREIVQRDIPYLGACYGLGALVSAVGGEVSKDKYSEPVSKVQISVQGQDPLLEGLPDSFDALVGHKEAVQSLPAGFVLLGSSPNCPYHFIRCGNNVYATQFHPELDGEGICTRIDAYKYEGYFNPEDAEALKAECRVHDISVPMELLRRFIQRYRT